MATKTIKLGEKIDSGVNPNQKDSVSPKYQTFHSPDIAQSNVKSSQPDLSMNNPAYKALIDKGYSAEQISNAWAGIQAKQTNGRYEATKSNDNPMNLPLATSPETEDNKITNDKVAKGELPKDRAEIYENPNPNQMFGTDTQGKNLGNWDYQDTSEKRQQEILANLESAYAANPNAFFNENEFKKVYNVGTGLRAKQQDETMMNWYKGKMDAIKKQDQLTKQLAQFKTMTKTELATITPEQSAIIFNSGDEQLLNQWMLAKKEKQQLDLLNGTISYEDILGGKDLYESNLSDEYKKDVTDQLSPLATELSEIEINYKNLQDSYNNILRDVTKEFEGTGATMSKINAVAAKRQREMLPQLQQAQNEYNGKANLYNAQKQLLQEEFKMRQQDIENERAELSDKLTLFKNMFGDIGTSTTSSTAGTKPIIENFGSTKSPNRRQWNEDTQKRESIEGIAGGGTSTTTTPSSSFGRGTETMPNISELGQLILNSKGGSKLLGATTQALSDAIGGMRSISSLNQAVINYEKKFGPIQGNLSKINPYDIDGQTIQAQIDLIRQRIGKALEGGVLRKEDEEKYKKILPTLKDTKQVALNKLSQLSIQIANDYNATLEGFARGGYDVSGFNILNGGITPQKPSTNVFTNTFNKYDKLLNEKPVVPTTTVKNKKVPNIPIGGIRFGF